jgi:hypothetical protein
VIDGNWLSVSDKDARVRGLYSRHYSAAFNANKPRQQTNRRAGRSGGVAGMGDYLALITVDCLALFIWKRPPDGINLGRQAGVVCSVFRNESLVLSSDLIREACVFAWQRWPGERLYTYVADTKIRSTNPGYCFKQAGWRMCGRNGLSIGFLVGAWWRSLYA